LELYAGRSRRLKQVWLRGYKKSRLSTPASVKSRKLPSEGPLERHAGNR
jgi:hypothetical protein